MHFTFKILRDLVIFKSCIFIDNQTHKLRSYTFLIFAGFWKQNTILTPQKLPYFCQPKKRSWLVDIMSQKDTKWYIQERSWEKKMGSHRMRLLSQETSSNQSHFSELSPQFCRFWCFIFLKACTHLKFESFSDWGKFSALSWVPGFVEACPVLCGPLETAQESQITYSYINFRKG